MNNIPLPYDSYQSAPPVSTYLINFISPLFGLLLVIVTCLSLVELTLGLFHWITSGQNMEKRILAKVRVKKGLIIFILTILVWLASIFYIHQYLGWDSL